MIALSAGCGRKADADSVGGDAVPDGGSTLEAVSGEAYELTLSFDFEENGTAAKGKEKGKNSGGTDKAGAEPTSTTDAKADGKEEKTAPAAKEKTTTAKSGGNVTASTTSPKTDAAATTVKETEAGTTTSAQTTKAGAAPRAAEKETTGVDETRATGQGGSRYELPAIPLG